MRLNSIYGNNVFDQNEKDKEALNTDVKKIILNVVDEILKGNSKLLVDIASGDRGVSDIKGAVKSILNVMGVESVERETVINGVINYLYGYGHLQTLIEDDDISDIDFSRYNYGLIKKAGKKEVLSSEFLFTSEKDFQRFIKTFIIRNNGVINETDPHCRVADDKHKLRINVSIPPRSRQASLNIRKHRQVPYGLKDLKQLGMFSSSHEVVLKDIVKRKKKFLIVGKGGSGKTTLLRAMMMESSDLDAFLVVEKDAELYIESPNFIQQRIKKSKFASEITLCDLVKDGLTMSLDGYVIGEIVGDEAWHIVNAGVTDHMICGTIHANSAEKTPLRLMTLIETYNPGIEKQTILDLISEAFDCFIYIKNFKIEDIVMVKGCNEDGIIMEHLEAKYGDI